METRKKFFMDCHLAGRKYHDADEVWDKLKVGTVLQLQRDLENRHDVDAVAVVYHNEEDGEDYKIGYLPREDNETIASILGMGWTNIFECRISKVNPDAHPEYQIHLTIKIVRNKE
ncbi:MAG: HIRAN domain-containing protein [Prevotella sp.]|nr:HIRAN domain-containing protein [Prevotella sp.]